MCVCVCVCVCVFVCVCVCVCVSQNGLSTILLWSRSCHYCITQVNKHTQIHTYAHGQDVHAILSNQHKCEEEDFRRQVCDLGSKPEEKCKPLGSACLTQILQVAFRLQITGH